MHGYDVAGAIGGPKSISRVSAVQGLRTAASLSDHYLRPEARIGPPRRFLVHLGKEEPFAIEIVDGVSAASTELPAVVDCHIGARPGPLLLVLTGRRSPAASALRREVVAWGRRPWLALRFAGYFESP